MKAVEGIGDEKMTEIIGKTGVLLCWLSELYYFVNTKGPHRADVGAQSGLAEQPALDLTSVFPW